VKIVADVAGGQGALDITNTSGIGMATHGDSIGMGNYGNSGGMVNQALSEGYGVQNTGSSGGVLGVDAAGTRTAIGLATANLDTQLAAIAADVGTIDNSGTYSYSNTVDDGSGNLLDGVFIELATDDDFTNIVTATHSNASGAFTVRSDQSGTHYLRLQLAGYSFTDQTVTLA
jgi:hypothetical protein